RLVTACHIESSLSKSAWQIWRHVEHVLGQDQHVCSEVLDNPYHVGDRRPITPRVAGGVTEVPGRDLHRRAFVILAKAGQWSVRAMDTRPFLHIGLAE